MSSSGPEPDHPHTPSEHGPPPYSAGPARNYESSPQATQQSMLSAEPALQSNASPASTGNLSDTPMDIPAFCELHWLELGLSGPHATTALLLPSSTLTIKLTLLMGQLIQNGFDSLNVCAAGYPWRAVVGG
ncbi:hypothetical protein LTR17_026590, partial [Elasticomyces elasticus]